MKKCQRHIKNKMPTRTFMNNKSNNDVPIDAEPIASTEKSAEKKTPIAPKQERAIWAIVPAAGLGRRMGSDLPKQYLTINKKTILEHTLTRLLSVESITAIVVVLDENDQVFATLPCAKNTRLMTAFGGKERCDSVLSALIALQQKVASNDCVLVHDAARCCILPSRVSELIACLKDDNVGGLLGVPVSDTLKQVDGHRKSTQTLDRSIVWAAQTPQLFPYDLLKLSLEKAIAANEVITDEASAIEFSGLQPQMVMGHYDNIKVTHPNDILIAGAIMDYQSLMIK
ncbi:MAG: 2-C-methyl-D-erythritol 4-phosphate cytidylyltransferase [Cellvibrionaceae bacterium]|jgi:2-C-methyl-D-erythritol 4-phosphate cytidylyltransferase